MRSFKKALINTVVFLALILAIALPLPVFYYEYSLRNWTSTTDVVERNYYAGTVDTVFSGASHGYKGFVPRIYDEKMGGTSYNLCGTLQTMGGRYAVLKEEVERNPVKTVILEVSLNSLSRDRDEESPEGDIDVIRQLVNRKDKITYAVGNLRLDEWGIAYYMAVHNGFSAVVECITQDRGTELQNSIARKGHLESEANDLSLTKSEYEAQYHTIYTSENIVEENLFYLEKIFNLCEERNIKVYMVTVPLSNRLVNSTANLDVIKGYYEDIAREHGCVYWDFNLWKGKEDILTDQADFYDDLHLATGGAEKFTAAFAEVMELESEGQDVSCFFYDSYEELN